MKIKLYQMKYIAGLCGNLIIIFFIIHAGTEYRYTCM